MGSQINCLGAKARWCGWSSLIVGGAAGRSELAMEQEHAESVAALALKGDGV